MKTVPFKTEPVVAELGAAMKVPGGPGSGELCSVTKGPSVHDGRRVVALTPTTGPVVRCHLRDLAGKVFPRHRTTLSATLWARLCSSGRLSRHVECDAAVR